MSPKIDAPYLWIRPFGHLKFSLRGTIDHHGPSIHSGHYTASINRCKENSIATITQLRSLELLIAKTLLLHMLYYMNWLTHDFWTRAGGWEFDRSHGAGNPLHHIDKKVEKQAPKPVGWMMCYLLMTFVPIQKLCVNINIYIYILGILRGYAIRSGRRPEGIQRSALRPLTSLGTSAWPYRVTTQYSFYPVQIYS